MVGDMEWAGGQDYKGLLRELPNVSVEGPTALDQVGSLWATAYVEGGRVKFSFATEVEAHDAVFDMLHERGIDYDHGNLIEKLIGPECEDVETIEEGVSAFMECAIDAINDIRRDNGQEPYALAGDAAARSPLRVPTQSELFGSVKGKGATIAKGPAAALSKLSGSKGVRQ